MFILIYVAVNIALSAFFEKQKWRIAAVAHSLLFAVPLGLLIIVYEEQYICLLFPSFAQTASLLRCSLTESAGMSAMPALLVIQTAVVICLIAMGIVYASETVEKIVRELKKLRMTVPGNRKDSFVYHRAADRLRTRRIYYFNCVMLC